ncbi:ferric-chelate reductase (NADPH) [Bradyrhizobium huanghuaihaiense]|uniref:NADPH-dependent ferric siderophore reductase n=1 Tax=Bradyrhizobium huanghuaihaiense TaxID=990078 RepID=A0A562S3L3_9BRAD|nr:siderophore-interacting protein [Bradyrhizobium huanghuaihaiense]TWI75110.1 NADPH-dependent ferric siderophore reductase [Bradyrhizobium huanghuaihaiense]
MIEPGQTPQLSEPSQVPQGRVTRMLLRWLMRPARVVTVETLSPHFRLIELEGEALKDVAWTAGQKIQVAIGAGLSARTYTPMSWDVRGRTRLLAFTHGDGPGARWASGLREGDICQFFGPRRSLDLAGLEAPVVLFGDETSFGLAAALRDNLRAGGALHMLEATDVATSQQVLEAISLGQARLIARSTGEDHLATVEAEMLRLAANGAQFILTGKASSIQRISRALKAAGVASSRIKAKAYWSPGKTGLD